MTPLVRPKPIPKKPDGTDLFPIPPPAPTPFIDDIYGTKHGVELPLRVWPAEIPKGEGLATAPAPLPWMLWIHGGGWTNGRHFDPNPWAIQAFRPRGYHVVAITHRLLPHVSIPDQVQDCKDAFEWCRTNLPRLLGEGNIDIDKYVVAGESAGGHLTLMMGHVLNPPPKALCALYPPVDLVTPHVGGPSPRQFPLELFTEEEVKAAIASRDPKEALAWSPGLFEATFLDEKLCGELWHAGEGFSYTKRDLLQVDIARYMFSNRLIMHVGLRREEFDSQEAFDEHARKWSPLFLLDGKETYPPTYLMHGEEDSTVGLWHSQKMAGKLRNMGVPVMEWYEPGQHVFDLKYMVSAMFG